MVIWLFSYLNRRRGHVYNKYGKRVRVSTLSDSFVTRTSVHLYTYTFIHLYSKGVNLIGQVYTIDVLSGEWSNVLDQSLSQ